MSVRQPFTVAQTHGILWRASTEQWSSSDHCGWASMYASTQREAPYQDRFPAVEDHLIILHLDGPVTVDRGIENRWERRCIAPGGMFVMPGGVDFGVCLGGSLSTLHLYVRRAVVEEVAAEMVRGDPACLELLPRFGNIDAVMARTLLGVQQLLAERDQADLAYVDYLARTIAARLIALCSPGGGSAPEPEPRARLGRAQLNRVIEFMRENMDASIGLTAIARVANLSPSHFARRFRATLGVTPHRFLMRLRVERAQWLLSATDLSVAEIAAATGFSHQEHMTRVFRRHYGTTPGAYRRGFRS